MNPVKEVTREFKVKKSKEAPEEIEKVIEDLKK
jgi:hypothetical protein